MDTNSSRHNTPTSTGEEDRPAAVAKRIALRQRVSVLDGDAPPPSSGRRGPQVVPPPLPVANPEPATSAPAHEKRTSDPDFVTTASKIAAADDQPPTSDRKSPWVEMPQDVLDVPKELPDAGPDGASQVTVVNPVIAPTTKPSKPLLVLSANDKKVLIAVSGAVMTICLIIVTAVTQQNKTPTITAEGAPDATGVTPIQITAGTLNAFTNGTQHDPANFTPFENPNHVIACPKPPSPGTKKGFDIRHCLIFKK